MNDNECPICGHYMIEYDNYYLCKYCGYTQKKDDASKEGLFEFLNRLFRFFRTWS